MNRPRALPDPHVPIGFVNGRPVYPIAGASQDGDDELMVSFSQSELTERLAREKQQGGRAAVKKLAVTLGFPDAAGLQAFVAAQRGGVPGQSAGAPAVDAGLAAREQALAAREAAADARERAALRRSVLAGLGATGEDLADAAALLDRDLDGEADEQAIAEAAQALKARRPGLFGAITPPAPGGAPAGAIPSAPHTPRPRDGAGGMEMARRRGYAGT
ncbi:hypothetical protein [Embleya sp. NPDC059237]|uniref:hypothetical protein n=1 Tax=Embleya sp. NPDC059237 TaxID=3346784 RepID=UPI0036A2BAE7